MADEFRYDVFLSHSAKDKAVVRPIAERLRADGLRVWFDEWEIRAGDSIPAKIEEGLEHSRVLVLCMSANAFGSDWAQLEAGTFRFRDPLNKERRFIPLRLDDAPIRGTLGQFAHVDWRSAPETEYGKLLAGCCGKPAKTQGKPPLRATEQGLRIFTAGPHHRHPMCGYFLTWTQDYNEAENAWSQFWAAKGVTMVTRTKPAAEVFQAAYHEHVQLFKHALDGETSSEGTELSTFDGFDGHGVAFKIIQPSKLASYVRPAPPLKRFR